MINLQPIVTYWADQSPCLTNSATLPMAMPLHQQSLINVFNSIFWDILNHQQALQKDTTIVISKLSDIPSQYNNNHF